MTDNNIGLDYNTSREKMAMPEYGRNVLRMVESLRLIEDKAKRSEQARAIIKVMEILNPQVHQQEDYEHRLWDQLYIIAGFDLDIDAPYPCPQAEVFSKSPVSLPMKDSRIKAAHYGRNIEKIINLLKTEPDGEVKTEMLRGLATYMRQQYLIWNKDSVADETIFHDIEKLSEHEITIPEGLSLDKISNSISYAKPGLGINVGQPSGKNHKKNNKQRNKKKQ